MKQLQKFGLFLALIIFLSSCGSLSITKMRYNRGFNIDWFGGKDDAGKATVKKEKTKKPAVQIAKDEEKIQEEEATYTYEEQVEVSNDLVATESIESFVPAAEMPKGNKAKRVQKVATKIAAKAPSKSTHSVAAKVKSSFSSMSHKAEASETNDSDVNLILLVILCFLLPPLAVYLYFGEINAHFWISLIFILLFGGFYGSFGLGFGGLALIHALLVVFGIFG